MEIVCYIKISVKNFQTFRKIIKIKTKLSGYYKKINTNFDTSGIPVKIPKRYINKKYFQK